MARGRDNELRRSTSDSDDNNGDGDGDSEGESSFSSASGSGSSGSSGSESGSGSGGDSDDASKEASKDGSNFEVSFWQSMKAVMPWTKEGEEARHTKTQ